MTGNTREKQSSFNVNLLSHLCSESPRIDSSAKFKAFSVTALEAQIHSWAAGVYLEFVALTPMFKFRFSFICPYVLEETVRELK